MVAELSLFGPGMRSSRGATVICPTATDATSDHSQRRRGRSMGDPRTARARHTPRHARYTRHACHTHYAHHNTCAMPRAPRLARHATPATLATPRLTSRAARAARATRAARAATLRHTPTLCAPHSPRSCLDTRATLATRAVRLTPRRLRHTGTRCSHCAQNAWHTCQTQERAAHAVKRSHVPFEPHTLRSPYSENGVFCVCIPVVMPYYLVADRE